MKNPFLLSILIIMSSCSLFKNEEKDILKGYFSYMADAAIFVDCTTNKKYPVAMEGDYITAEKEYLKIVKNGGEKILVSVSGKIVERDRIEREGKRDFLVISKFHDFSPNENCN